MKDRLENVELRDWQRHVDAILSSNEVHPRRMYWIWDKTGNKGKSFLATYCTATLDCIIFENSKSADLKYGYNERGGDIQFQQDARGDNQLPSDGKHKNRTSI